MYRIIIIDDEDVLREGVEHLFPWNHMGFEVVGSFAKAKDALAYIREGNPVDVLMTDIAMPGLTGIELAAEINKLKLPVKIVFFSAYQHFQYTHEAILNRVVDYLVKPLKYGDVEKCFFRLKEILDQEQKKNTVGAEVKYPGYYEGLISQVDDYIRNNYRDATLNKLANEILLSPAYLSRIIKEKTGESFQEKLIRAKMEKAKELLRDVRYYQYEIAGLVGYDNPNNFARAFKKYTSMSPTEYRMKNGKKHNDA